MSSQIEVKQNTQLLLEAPTIRVQPPTIERQFRPALKQRLQLTFIDMPPKENQVAIF